MSFIEDAAMAVQNDPMSASDFETGCRFAVASKMRECRRLLAENEVEDIVEDMVGDYSYVDPEDRISEDSVEMTDIEWDLYPEGEKVVYGEEDGVVVGGRFYPVRISEDSRVASVSKRIYSSISEIAHIAGSLGMNERSLFHTVPDVNMPCPCCSSRNVTPVWFDDGDVTACCNDCGFEFDASLDDVALATIEERTVEDVDIIPEMDIFGSVWCRSDGRLGYEVYGSGELVDAGDAGSFSEVLARFDDIADAYDSISEGVGIDFTSGGSESVAGIEDDSLVMRSGRTASRIRVARMVADGSALLDMSHVERISAVPGQGFHYANGSIVVSSVEGGLIYADVWEPRPDGRLACVKSRFTEAQLVDKLKRECYLK